VLENKVYIFNLSDLKLIDYIETCRFNYFKIYNKVNLLLILFINNMKNIKKYLS
jgi:hypothetical protein